MKVSQACRNLPSDERKKTTLIVLAAFPAGGRKKLDPPLLHSPFSFALGERKRTVTFPYFQEKKRVGGNTVKIIFMVTQNHDGLADLWFLWRQGERRGKRENRGTQGLQVSRQEGDRKRLSLRQAFIQLEEEEKRGGKKTEKTRSMRSWCAHPGGYKKDGGITRFINQYQEKVKRLRTLSATGRVTGRTKKKKRKKRGGLKFSRKIP